jgi:hypothetical protein
MQNKIPAKNQSPVATHPEPNKVQNTSNFPQNTGKNVDSRREKGPEDGQQ